RSTARGRARHAAPASAPTRRYRPAATDRPPGQTVTSPPAGYTLAGRPGFNVKPTCRVNHPADPSVNIDRRWLLRAAALALAAAAVAACGSSSGNGGGSGPTPTGSGPVITIKDFGYGAPLTVAPGATVTVRQEDAVQHDVSSATFKTPLLGRGEPATFTAPPPPRPSH